MTRSRVNCNDTVHITASIPAENPKFHRQLATLADFGTFAFQQADLDVILAHAARVCANSLGVPFSKICKFQKEHNDLRVVAGYGWREGVVGYAISMADESTPQGRAFTTGKPQTSPNIAESNTYSLPSFYPQHGIIRRSGG